MSTLASETPAPSGRARARFFTGALAVLVLIATVLLTEASFRLLKRVVCLTAGTKLFAPHPLYGWKHEPYAEGWTQGCLGWSFEWRAWSRMNAHGLRDREMPVARRPGMARVLLLGDSFPEGMQVPLEETFAKRLEALLAAQGREVEVVNAGVSGFGTDNELLFFTADGRRYRPDLVLLGVTPANDIIENARHLYVRMYADAPDGPPPKAHFKLGRDGRLRLDARAARRHWDEVEARRTTWYGRLWLTLQRHLHVVRFTRAILGRPRLRPDAKGIARATILGVYAVPPSREWADAWALTDALLRRLDREVKRDGATLAAVVIPSKEAVSDALWRRMLALSPDPEGRTLDPEQPTRTMTAMLARGGIPTLDLLPLLRERFRATGRTGYFDWDIHFTTEGHAVVAEALVPFVARLLAAHPRSAPAPE